MTKDEIIARQTEEIYLLKDRLAESEVIGKAMMQISHLTPMQENKLIADLVKSGVMF